MKLTFNCNFLKMWLIIQTLICDLLLLCCIALKSSCVVPLMQYREKLTCTKIFSDKHLHQGCVKISAVKVSDIMKTNFCLSAV
jgi:hypothetical protein